VSQIIAISFQLMPMLELRAGAKVIQVVSFLGVKLEPTGEITALEPNRSFTYKGRKQPPRGRTGPAERRAGANIWVRKRSGGVWNVPTAPQR
jgi:hypothetical protein